MKLQLMLPITLQLLELKIRNRSGRSPILYDRFGLRKM